MIFLRSFFDCLIVLPSLLQEELRISENSGYLLYTKLFLATKRTETTLQITQELRVCVNL